MAPPTIIDSHIHLWPASAANPAGHGWMNEGDMLTKEHVLSDYCKAAKQDPKDQSLPKVRGVVYVETDRRLEETTGRALHQWAHQPTEEIKFLRSIVEKQHGERDSDLLLGLVPWAPVNQGVDVFEDWLKHAEQTAGPETWSRIKGFRFLLQAITDQKVFESLVFSEGFISVLKSFRGSGRNFSFDVGVDQHSGGVWQLEALVKVIEQVHAGVEEKDKVIFILNHLCKPDLTQAPNHPSKADHQRWTDCITRFSHFPNVYMKLSGAFSELSADRVSETSASDIVDRMTPWLDHVFRSFGPGRIMFGSDWPVCNVRGPATEDSWVVWKDVVEHALARRGLKEEEKQMVWSGTAAKAYRLEV